MKIFHALDNPDILPVFHERTGIKLNVLISYAYQKGNISIMTKKYRGMIDLLYLDSGAYSVYTGKIKISTGEYATFLKKYGDLFDGCFTMDDRFDDADHNLQNQEYLEDILSDKSWKPIPVIHDFTDPMGEFKMYEGLGHKYIALGSIGTHKKISTLILDEVTNEHPKIKIHMFGQLNMKLLQKYKPYSADSAGWAHTAGIGGSVFYWRPSEKKRYGYSYGGLDTKKAKDNKMHIKNSPFWDEIEDFLAKTLKYTYPDLQSTIPRQVMNLYSFIQFEKYVNSLR